MPLEERLERLAAEELRKTALQDATLAQQLQNAELERLESASQARDQLTDADEAFARSLMEADLALQNTQLHADAELAVKLSNEVSVE